MSSRRALRVDEDELRGQEGCGKAAGVENLSKGVNNRVSSVKNRVDVTTYLHSKRNGEGEIRCFASGDKIANLGDSYDFDNEASSSKIPQGSNPCF